MNKHFTATAFLIDSRKRTLLLWHKRLQRWMPPGGHIDPDETPEAAAVRECKEETGLDVVIIGEDQDDLFANNPEEGKMLLRPFGLFLENIPASAEYFDGAQYRRGEEAHQHMDFVYVARPLDESQVVTLAQEEAREICWFTREEIAMMNPQTEIFANVQGYILSIM